VILVVIAVLLATAAGVIAEHRSSLAERAARFALGAMLYALVPFVSYVSFAHLTLSLGAGVGLGLAYVGLALAGLLAFVLGRRLGLARPSLGALVCTVILANTGYLGLPMSVVLLGSHALGHAVAYDQVVSGPLVFTVGFAVGAAFGSRGRSSVRGRVMGFLTRNPPLAAALAGLLVPRAWAPHVLVLAAHDVVDGLLVLGFFAVGVFLSSERRADRAPLLERPDARVGLAMLLRFVVNPLLLLLVGLAGVGIPSAYLLQAAMPSGINSLIVGHAFGLDQRLIATIIVWSTALVLVVAAVSVVG
jgi:predicted permease